MLMSQSFQVCLEVIIIIIEVVVAVHLKATQVNLVAQQPTNATESAAKLGSLLGLVCNESAHETGIAGCVSENLL